MRGDGSSKRLSFEESRNVALLMFTCIRMLLILIYVLYKSKSLTLVTIGYSWIHSWDIFIEHCFWAQEAVCNQVIDVGTGFMKILYLGRAPRTKETLPDFREKCRVTRHSRALRGLTGSQQTPGFWGVTSSGDRRGARGSRFHRGGHTYGSRFRSVSSGSSHFQRSTDRGGFRSTCGICGKIHDVPCQWDNVCFQCGQTRHFRRD